MFTPIYFFHDTLTDTIHFVYRGDNGRTHIAFGEYNGLRDFIFGNLSCKQVHSLSELYAEEQAHNIVTTKEG